jgi:ring-1,2-phenylacetyl-CoA epoxidase subunit PaaD
MPETDQHATVQSVYDCVARVCDPEMPTVSIVDLGMVEEVTVSEGRISVVLIPTFVGCPAQPVIARDVRAQLEVRYPDYAVEVKFALIVPWTSARITEAGREALQTRGIAPPGRQLEEVVCPFCHDARPVLHNVFASTSCRSLYYCSQCHNPFEAFKP